MPQLPSLPGVDVDALLAYVRAHKLTDASELRLSLISGGRSNLTFHVAAGGEEWVLRRPPLGELPKGAHDMSREAQIISALGPSPVPVPDVLQFCEDISVIGAPFILMRRAPGAALKTLKDVEELDAPARNRLFLNLIDTLAALHAVEPEEVGLSSYGRPVGFVDRQLRTWTRQLEARGPNASPTLLALSELLEETVPQNHAAAIVHGDFRLDNCLVVEDQVTAVLDWELSTLGHPLADLATFLVYHDGLADHPNPVVQAPGRIAGSPSAEQLTERYASATGHDLSELGWFLGLAWFKLAVILEGVLFRVRTGRTPGVSIEGVDELVATCAVAGRRALSA